MAEGGVSFEEHSLKIAKDFLHTVVVVDDEADYGPAKVDPTSTLKPPGKSDTTSDDSGVPPVHRHHLNAKQLSDTFAEEGMVCAILKPDQGEDSTEKADHASQRADIVVLDWRLVGDYGSITTQTIKKIIQTDNGRLRLIVVYSGENLDGIFDTLENIEVSAEKDRVRKKITFGNVRLLLLAKEKTAQNNFPDQTCDEKELPARITDEFRDFTMGLLSNATLKSISLIRANAHTLLTHFRPELDAAFLTHRALIAPPDEAEEHIAPLLLDEMHSILDSESLGNEVSTSIIDKWLKSESKQNTQFRRRLKVRDSESDTIDKLIELLTKGHESRYNALNLDKQRPKGNWEKLIKNIKDPRKIHQLTALWRNTKGRKSEIDKALAYQMISNRRYIDPAPMLKLGTIVKNIESSEYYLCVQPLCDCVRVKSPRDFTLIQLKLPNDNNQPEIIIKEDKEYILLRINYRPHEAEKIRFKGNNVTHTVLAAKAENNDYIFKSHGSNNIEFLFVSELKNSIAQRILTKFGHAVSRHGLTESEWLRRSSGG